jgi:hypothetical protein
MNIIATFPVKDTWLAQCISENGKALPIVTNALVALRRVQQSAMHSPLMRCSARRC